jgi:hypothetical protein
MTRAEMRASLELMPTWALEQKAAANRQLIAVTRQRLAAGEQVPRMYQEPGLAWLERQAEVAEDLVAERLSAYTFTCRLAYGLTCRSAVASAPVRLS